ncbi:pentatricopeptide repeat-containing protein [Salvia divinorum]
MRHLIEVDPRSPAAYLLLSFIYAALGRWECANEVRDLMSSRHIEMDQAFSRVEIDRKLQLDTERGRESRDTTSVLELLADGSTL